MNTSKSLDDTLSDLIASVIVAATSETPIAPAMKAKKKAVAAIVEAVEGLAPMQDEPTPTHYDWCPGMCAVNHRKIEPENTGAGVRNKFRAELRQAIKEWQ